MMICTTWDVKKTDKKADYGFGPISKQLPADRLHTTETDTTYRSMGSVKNSNCASFLQSTLFSLTPKCTADLEHMLKIHNGYIAISTDKSLVNKQKSKKTFQIIFRSVRLPLYAHKYQLAVSSSPVACVKYY